ncbi:sigma-70 family RNA polymerase sigma factor [Enterococcus sp. BWB1-3]|uniref:sigma-70 family RNA polymerase sigma factor n=1 Tax=Enterococcus sp. BWB1-3 TaxID=2787713 RepID=UPI00192147BE|nr:sigma-70 family RNA polymerase sigma factor [Enterococcus sp. BWB1-3]MBL1229300.1 sigma-70 family RNA polymerase sigma factor [Enterococcus sp. BWB1-3]
MSQTEEEITGMFITYIHKSLVWRKIDFYSKEQNRINTHIFESFDDFEEDRLYIQKNKFVSIDKLFDQSLEIQLALNQLTDKEHYILQRKYYGDLTNLEIANKLGISSQRVSKLKRRALVKLRIFLSSKDSKESFYRK